MDHFKFDVFYHFGAYVSYMVEKALATLMEALSYPVESSSTVF